MDLFRRRRDRSPADPQLDALIASALNRLRSLGNPGAVLVPGPALRTQRVGWLLSSGADPGQLHLLPTGQVLLDGRAVSTGRLDAGSRQVVVRWLERYALDQGRSSGPPADD